MNLKLYLIFLFCLFHFGNSLTCLTDSGCSQCSSDTLICQTCYDGYVLSSDNTCSYSASICSQKSGVQCIFSFCLVQGSQYYYNGYQNICTTCVQPYVSYNQGCAFYCSIIGSYVQDIKNCKPACTVNNCDQCSQTQSTVCVSCSSGYYLFNNSCVSICPQATYLDSSLNICSNCKAGCSTCSSKDTCTLCFDQSNSNLPDCKCPTGKVFSDLKCQSSCKYNYQAVNQVCQSLCSDKMFPVYSKNSTDFVCEEVASSSSDYCAQNVNDLPKLISIAFSSLNSATYLLTVQFQQTSLTCFQVVLQGINQYSFSQNYVTNFSNYSETEFQMNLADLQNSDAVYCSYSNCYLYLKVYWKGYVAYTFQISLLIQLKGSLINSLTYNSDYQEVKIVCENCVIPSNQIIPSQVQVACATGQTCTSDSITTSTSSSIVITQTISDSTLKKNTVLPHSLKLSYYDKSTGYNVDTYINNYTYVNSVLGQITYTFSAKPVQNAQLTVTSTITNAVASSRILSSSSTEVKYPQMTLSVTIEGDTITENEDSKSNSTIIIVVVAVVCVLVSLSIAGFFGYRLYKKNQLKKIALKAEQGKDAEEPQNIAQEQQCQLDNSVTRKLKEQKQNEILRKEQYSRKGSFGNERQQMVRIEDIVVDELKNLPKQSEQNIFESSSQRERIKKDYPQHQVKEGKGTEEHNGEVGMIVLSKIGQDEED